MTSHRLRSALACFIVAACAIAIAHLTDGVGLADIAFTALLAFLAGYLVCETEEPAP